MDGFFFLFACQIFFSAIGKRQLEYTERCLFSLVVAEKTLRAQAEFKLSQLQPRPSSRTADEQSIPTTTQSGEIFRGLEDGSEAGAQQQYLATVGEMGRQEQWLLCEEELTLKPAGQIEVLGVGGFGAVIVGSCLGTPVAIKILRRTGHLNSLADIGNELRVLRKLRHPNIVLFHGACLAFQSGDMVVVLERVIGETLEAFMRGGAEDGPPGSAARCEVLLGTCRALMYLHSRQPRVVHGDIKSVNIMVEHRHGGGDPGRYIAHAKLLDFGLARMLTRHAKSLGGTRRWAAPEVFLARTAPSSAADVFSFGMLIFFVTSGERPRASHTEGALRRMAQRRECIPLEWPLGTPFMQQSRPIVEQCTKFEPEGRPSIVEVHKSLKSLSRWTDYVHESLSRWTEYESDLEPVPSSDVGGPECRDDFWRRVQGIRHELPRLLEAKAKRRDSAPQPAQARGTPPQEHVQNLAVVPENFPAAQDIRWAAAEQVAVAAPTAPLALPEFAETPFRTMLFTTIDLLLSWNYQVPQSSCCLLHAAVRCLAKVHSALSSALCQQDFCPAGDCQCRDCGLLAEPNMESCCANCGATFELRCRSTSW